MGNEKERFTRSNCEIEPLSRGKNENLNLSYLKNSWYKLANIKGRLSPLFFAICKSENARERLMNENGFKN